jgi:hypothetical protein
LHDRTMDDDIMAKKQPTNISRVALESSLRPLSTRDKYCL